MILINIDYFKKHTIHETSYKPKNNNNWERQNKEKTSGSILLIIDTLDHKITSWRKSTPSRKVTIL